MSQYDDELAAMEAHYELPKSVTAAGEQGTPEWMARRCGNVTASYFHAVMDRTKKGTEGASRRNYRVQVVCERITGIPTEHYVSLEMEWGTEHEPIARMAYEAATGCIVEQVGYQPHPMLQRVGGSPDGLVGDDGIIEIKCCTTPVHVTAMLTGDMSAYQDQVHGYLWITGRKWCDMVLYDPRLPDGLKLHVQRIGRDDAYIAKIEAEVIQFCAEVDEQHSALLARIKK
jgi:predicted phage-related endonuclease